MLFTLARQIENVLEMYYFLNFTRKYSQRKASPYLRSKIWNLGILCFSGCPFHWHAHSVRFNYLWLSKVIHLEQLEVIWKDGIYSGRESQQSQVLSGSMILCHFRDLLKAFQCSWSAGIATFLNSESLCLEPALPIWGGSLLQWL